MQRPVATGTMALFGLRNRTNLQSGTNFARPLPASLTARDTYLLQEMQAASNRVQWYLELHERLESSALAVTAGVWVLVVSQELGAIESLLIWLPPAYAVASAIKSYFYTKTLREASEYLHRLEDYFELEDEQGWVHYVRASTRKYKTLWRTRFWTLVILAGFTAPLVLSHDTPDPSPKAPQYHFANSY